MTAVGLLEERDVAVHAKVPQYAFTSDRSVIAVVEANLAGRRAFHAEALAFAGKYGNDPQHRYQPRSASGKYTVHGIAGDRPTDGDWVSASKTQSLWRPARRNPALREMTAITHTNAPIPGLSAAYDGEVSPDGTQSILYPQVFVQEGVAWFNLVEPAHPAQTDMWGSGEFDKAIWTPARASQWHAAQEAHTDALALLRSTTAHG